jgi:hypothetical protein
MLSSFDELMQYVSSLIDALAKTLDAIGLPLDVTARVILLILTLAPILFFLYRTHTATRRAMFSDYDGGLTAECPASSAQVRQANDILRAELGRKRFVSLTQYRALVKRNDHVLTAIVDEDGKMVGYFDVFPLMSQFAVKLLTGELTELDMDIESEHSKITEENSDYIYLGAIFNTETNNVAKRHEVTFCLLRNLSLHVLSLYPPRPGRKYLALASSESGERLLRSHKFSHVQHRRDRSDKTDLYVLDSANVEPALAKIYQRFGDIRYK